MWSAPGGDRVRSLPRRASGPILQVPTVEVESA